MEQRSQPQEPEAPAQKKESAVSKTMLAVIGVFLLIIIAIVSWGVLKPSKSKEEGEKPGMTSPLDRISTIELGRLEIKKAMDPLGASSMGVRMSVTLTVPAERAAELEAKIRKFEAIFKEITRRAFLDADPRDVRTENLAGVKAAIKAKINEQLGEDAVQEVIFGDFSPY